MSYKRLLSKGNAFFKYTPWEQEGVALGLKASDLFTLLPVIGDFPNSHLS